MTNNQSPKPKTISPERRERFTWDKGDLKFFNSRDELEKRAKKNDEKIIWYDKKY